MSDFPSGPEQTPPAASTDPSWGPPNPNYPLPPAGYPPPPAGQYPPPGYAGQPVASPGLSTNSAAALSYVTFIPAVIFLVLEPYNKNSFIKFHAWQCIVLTLTSIVLSVLFVATMFVPMFGMRFLIHSIVRLALFIFWLIAIIKASKGERYKIPIIGDIAENLAGKM